MKHFYREIQALQQPFKNTPFEGWTDEQMDEHIAKSQYGDFRLTEAIRPSPTFVPHAGYRFDTYHDRETGMKIPVIMAAASREALFDLFMGFVEQIEGETADVVLETSFGKKMSDRECSVEYCEDVDAVALRSNLWDFQDILMDDGCTGIAVLNPSVPVEVQFDEHKLLIVYGNEETLYPFEEILQDAGIHRNDDIRFITEEPHIHSSQEEFVKRFKDLQILLSGDCDF